MTPSLEAPSNSPSVIAGVIQRLSVSQLKKHKLCPRAWYFAKVLRLPEPSTGAQQVGTEGHAQLEHYLSTGEDVLGAFAKAGAHLLPTPGPDLLVEQPLDGAPPLTAGGIPFTGFIDLVDARNLATDGVLRITDHKFTSNIASNAATPEQLADANTEPGLQMVGYGAWALSQAERFPGVRELELEHLYYQTRGQRLAASVVASVPVEHIAREWRTKVEPQVEAMKTHAQAARASDVPANYGPACTKYGGCPFMAKCLTGENKTMSLRDKLLSKPSESVPTTDAAVDLPAVLPPDAPQPAPVQMAPEVAEQPAPKRRGRPRKAPEPAQATSDLRVLFVDCVPTKHDGPRPESLTGYVDDMHHKVAQAGGVDDVRFAGSDSPLGFGKWRGALAMAARVELPPPGIYTALGVAQSELMQVIVEALEPSFDVVVRGIR
ncbi:PD-(D/E)XK nuclease family protein [Myxococcus llanfairpwllgwyngyllgogerychwyrndrobwllllantysiliogogogochensis]|uniref:PD-(D/E)XK nuclease family protein n=1 Tax=Myxococcus llanfairpwllgwyngyllgogerychwyrndrobwllllantysiliogogogochensis TaxID=2590453 RepID=A0A540WZ09_9BACT|nr:PD-(D/E)XK nuclease family protein [Myxococcus llanfairpwllgwyngyllgogerychwyrndrobwllllantysiliogogogochensis]TQF14235.1 PD-(D/E)XK nuclease family protein [Myxococcus llanfairpwllgwyngyllgogerychwyrndrobwllllantysiliogogogochensis]